MPLRSVSVLLVDDEPIAMSFMRRALEMKSYAVLAAAGYDEALEVFSNHPEIDVVVADVSLSSKNGVDVARTLLRAKPSLKVLFTSASVSAEAMQSSGVPDLENLFLPKPFSAAALTAAVARILSSSELPNLLAIT